MCVRKSQSRQSTLPIHYKVVSLSAVVKVEVEWKESQLPQLIEKLNDIHNRQMQNTEMAILKRGGWRFSTKFQCLERDENKVYKTVSRRPPPPYQESDGTQPSEECSHTAGNHFPLTPETTGVPTVALSTLVPP